MPRKPNGKEPEIVLTSGRPLVVGRGLKAKSLSAAFLAAYQDDFENEGQGIFRLMYERYPQDYFNGLITLARIMKVEIGAVGAFDKPQNREEALRRLEETAGPHARQMLEKFLDQVSAAEAKVLDNGSDGS